MADADTIPDPVIPLLRELESVFGTRLRSVCLYGGNGEAESLTGGAAGESHGHIHTLVVVESIDPADLRGCANLAKPWARRGLATPLLLSAAELARSLDAFPLEFAEILAHHRVVAGIDVLAGLTVAPADIRRACEVQARSHLLHLREGFIQAAAEPRQLGSIIQASSRSFRLLLVSMARLDGVDLTEAAGLAGRLESTVGLAPGVVRQVLAAGGSQGISATDAQDLYPAYIQAVERLVQYADAWQA
jgi:hypothetical protein